MSTYSNTLAAIQARPRIDPHELDCSIRLLKCARLPMRDAYRLLQARPDLTSLLTRAADALTALEGRLSQELKGI